MALTQLENSNTVFDLKDRVNELMSIIFKGNGSPEGVVTANQGAMYLRQDGGAGTTLYVKETGTGNTGWVEK